MVVVLDERVEEGLELHDAVERKPFSAGERQTRAF